MSDEELIELAWDIGYRQSVLSDVTGYYGSRAQGEPCYTPVEVDDDDLRRAREWWDSLTDEQRERFLDNYWSGWLEG